jgi:hypothetical protein
MEAKFECRTTSDGCGTTDDWKEEKLGEQIVLFALRTLRWQHSMIDIYKRSGIEREI